MCFNETASIVALSIGIVFSTILFYYNHIAYAGILFVVSLMQLYEYFAHHSIITKNKNLNTLATKLIFFGVFIQPIAYAYFNTYYLPKNSTYNYPAIINLLPALLFIYIAYSIFLYMHMNNNNMFVTKYLKTPCTSICRLNWFNNMDDYTTTLYLIIFLILYMAIMSLYSFYDPKLPIQYMCGIFLVLAVFYTFFILKLKITPGISVFGSIWCFLAVFMGPYLLYFLNF
jgi:hypothetical protein